MSRRLCLAVLFVAGIAAVCFGFKRAQYLSLPKELRWSSGKITASPENTVIFIRARMKFIADRLSPTTPNPVIPTTKAKAWLQVFLDSEDLEKGLGVINQAKIAAAKKKFRIILIADEHADSVQGTQAKSSVTRQQEISDYVKKHGFPVVFSEGNDFELSSENLYAGIRKAAEKIGREFPLSFDEFKRWRRENDMKHWWDDFLDKETPKVIGVDRHASIQDAVLLLANLDCKEVSKEECINTAQWLNMTYRTQLVLATVILDMEARNMDEGALVLGEMHIEPQKHLCKEWGIELTIAD